MLATAEHMCGYDQGLEAEGGTEKKKMQIGINHTQEGIGYETWAIGERNAYLRGNYKSLCRMWVTWVQNGETRHKFRLPILSKSGASWLLCKNSKAAKRESSYGPGESASFGFSAKLE
jgi:hypothetical protein